MIMGNSFSGRTIGLHPVDAVSITAFSTIYAPRATGARGKYVAFDNSPFRFRFCSSSVERHVEAVGVGGSIPSGSTRYGVRRLSTKPWQDIRDAACCVENYGYIVAAPSNPSRIRGLNSSDRVRGF